MSLGLRSHCGTITHTAHYFPWQRRDRARTTWRIRGDTFWPGRVSIAALLADSLWDHSEHKQTVVTKLSFAASLKYLEKKPNNPNPFMEHFYRPSSVGWTDSFSFHHAAFSHNHVIINNFINQVFVWMFVAAAQFTQYFYHAGMMWCYIIISIYCGFFFFFSSLSFHSVLNVFSAVIFDQSEKFAVLFWT